MMNPPSGRPLGRGRASGGGGGGFRPYFFFRRNGRTIPAGGRGNYNAAGTAGRERVFGGSGGGGAGGGYNYRGGGYTYRGGGYTYRGGGYARRRGGPSFNANAATHPPSIQLDSSFFRPECYAAPEDAQYAVQNIAADMPQQCPGWHLYFPQEAYDTESELAKRIEALQDHYNRYATSYDLNQILVERFFKIDAKIIADDESMKDVWPLLKDDMVAHTQRTLATFGVAMHKIATIAVVNGRLSQQTCNRYVYVPRCTLPHKIYVRPVGFQELLSIVRIDSSLLDSLCSVRGIVTSVGNVEAAASWIAYKCPRCGQEQAMRQSGFYTTRPYSCKRDGCLAKKNFIEQRSSPFTRIKPQQIIQIQDNNIQTPIDLNRGIPANLDIELKYDLVDTLICGQDVIINGILKIRSLTEDQNLYPKSTASVSKIYMKAVSVIDAEHMKQKFTQRDMDAIAMINSEPDTFKLLTQSLAPELHGSELIKAGMLLSLFGGAGSQMHNDCEINVLLVGDPGIGKSHLLEMCAKVSPRATLISGKRSSANTHSLTTTLQGRTNYILNSGALNTSNMGHCAIDDIDRLASYQDILLQLMQSKIVCLPFPALFTTIVTPTSIIAAANSLRGHYDQSRLLTENIRLNALLLQQFHLIFLMIDKSNRDLDQSLTEHIKALQDGAKNSSAIAARFDLKTKTYNTENIVEHNAADYYVDDEHYDLEERLKLRFIDFDKQEEMDLLPTILLKKFIVYARQHCSPLLTAEAAEALKIFYSSLREKAEEEKRCSVSTSHLQGLICLSQARARLDFADEVTRLHVRDVVCIVRHSLDETATNDFLDKNPATASASTSQRSTMKRFLQVLQMRSSALARRIFDYDELKEIATRAGITCGVSNLVDMVNLQGYLLKKGPNLYELMAD